MRRGRNDLVPAAASANRATGAIPLVFLSGDEDSVFKAMASRECAGVFAILKKPASADQLFTTIDAALNESRS